MTKVVKNTIPSILSFGILSDVKIFGGIFKNMLKNIQNNLVMKNGQVKIRWNDSYGIDSGWKDISDYSAELLTITSWGKVIYEDKKVIALAHNYADETENTCKQANGIMVIPKVCIIEIIPIS